MRENSSRELAERAKVRAERNGSSGFSRARTSVEERSPYDRSPGTLSIAIECTCDLQENQSRGIRAKRPISSSLFRRGNSRSGAIMTMREIGSEARFKTRE